MRSTSFLDAAWALFLQRRPRIVGHVLSKQSVIWSVRPMFNKKLHGRIYHFLPTHWQIYNKSYLLFYWSIFLGRGTLIHIFVLGLTSRYWQDFIRDPYLNRIVLGQKLQETYFLYLCIIIFEWFKIYPIFLRFRGQCSNPLLQSVHIIPAKFIIVFMYPLIR